MDFTKYHFVYNANAYFASMDKYPDGLFEAITKNGRDGLEALCWALQTMSEQAELLRQYMGYEKSEVFNAKEAMVVLKPREIPIARTIAIGAIEVGLNMNDEENEELDLVIVELQKKTNQRD